MLQLIGRYEFVAALSVLSHREVFLQLLIVVRASQPVLVLVVLLLVEGHVVHAVLDVLHAAVAGVMLHRMLL